MLCLFVIILFIHSATQSSCEDDTSFEFGNDFFAPSNSSNDTEFGNLVHDLVSEFRTTIRGGYFIEDEEVMKPVKPFYGDFFRKVFDAYAPIHGYLAIIVCVFGIIANILNIAILTRKELFNPAIVILIVIAITDILVMTEYIPYAIVKYIMFLRPPPTDKIKYETYFAGALNLFHPFYYFTLRDYSTWLHVLLAMWRLGSIRFVCFCIGASCDHDIHCDVFASFLAEQVRGHHSGGRRGIHFSHAL